MSEAMRQPRCYQLVGVPASGKSTWAAKQTWQTGTVVVSTDEYIERWARERGSTYSEVFTELMPAAVDAMASEVVKAREAGVDIVWDQTSTTVASRARKFRMLPHYYHIAVVFETPSRIELKRRLDSRPGKEIPGPVIEGMIVSFQPPSEAEGFKEIWKVWQLPAHKV